MADYRNALRAKGIRPMTPAVRNRLRTAKAPGDVEVLRHGLHRYDTQPVGLMFPLALGECEQ
jgi:hypothetical protein